MSTILTKHNPLKVLRFGDYMAANTAIEIVFDLTSWFSPEFCNRHHPLLLIANEKWKYTEIIVTDYSLHGEVNNPDKIFLEHGFSIPAGVE